MHGYNWPINCARTRTGVHASPHALCRILMCDIVAASSSTAGYVQTQACQVRRFTPWACACARAPADGLACSPPQILNGSPGSKKVQVLTAAPSAVAVRVAVSCSTRSLLARSHRSQMAWQMLPASAGPPTASTASMLAK